jgi:hypothetical protein
MATILQYTLTCFVSKLRTPKLTKIVPNHTLESPQRLGNKSSKFDYTIAYYYRYCAENLWYNIKLLLRHTDLGAKSESKCCISRSRHSQPSIVILRLLTIQMMSEGSH